MRSKPVVGRYAPSPSGLHHLGNLRSAVLAWVDAQAHGGSCVHCASTIWISLVSKQVLKNKFVKNCVDWARFDPMPAGPRQPGESSAPEHEACRQLDRRARYGAVLDQLIALRAVYPCSLSGRSI